MPVTLVTVSGISPAILTETLWALALETPAVVPDEVVVITTARGETDLRARLLTPLDSWGGLTVWQRLRQDILLRARPPAGTAAATPLQLSLRVIDLPDPVSGVRRPADDLRTRAHHDETANFIIQTLAPFCDAEDYRVIASIAGGRKTMGALLYAAMSLLGKETDRVTHVLVSDPYDTLRDFYYPGQPVQELRLSPSPANAAAAGPSDASGAPVAGSILARDAIVELADIPFVPLRNKFSELNEPRRSFAGLVERYSRAERPGSAKPPRVFLTMESGVLSVDDRSLSLTGRELLVSAFLLQRALDVRPHFRDRMEALPLLHRYQAQWKKDYPFHQATTRLSGELSSDDITKALATLRKKLTAAGLTSAIPYLAPERSRIGFETAPPATSASA